jgi:hypothetical protein
VAAPQGSGLSRRALLAGAALGLAGGPHRATAQSAARFGGVRVDAGPLAARGGGGAAALIQRIMPAKLQQVFADLIAPGVRGLPVLVARIDTLYLTGFADTPAGDSYLRAQDTMTGAGLVVSGRQTMAETPLRVTLPPSYSGTWYLPDIDTRRIDSLSYQFAYWLRREMQL